MLRLQCEGRCCIGALAPGGLELSIELLGAAAVSLDGEARGHPPVPVPVVRVSPVSSRSFTRIWDSSASPSRVAW